MDDGGSNEQGFALADDVPVAAAANPPATIPAASPTPEKGPADHQDDELGFADEPDELPRSAFTGGGPGIPTGPTSPVAADDDELGFADDLPEPAKAGQGGASSPDDPSGSPDDEAWLHVDEDLSKPVEDHPARQKILTSDYEFSGPCPVCGTRFVATDDQIGSTIRCPDCHSHFEIREPLPKARQPLRKTASSWDDDDEFRLEPAADLASMEDLGDPTAEAPTRGSGSDGTSGDRLGGDEIGGDPLGGDPLSGDPLADDPLAGTLPGGTSPLSDGPASDDWGGDTLGSGPLDDLDDLDTDDRLPHSSSVQPVPVGTPSFPNSEWGGAGDRVAADAALRKAEAEADIEEEAARAKALPPRPLINGVLNCFQDPTFLLRWLLFAFAIQVECSVINGAIARALIDDPVAQLMSMMMGCFAFFFGIAILVAGAVTLLAVTQDTANGEETIENWPDANFMDWFFESSYIFCALFVSFLAGPFGLIVFPIYLLATLESGLPVNPISGPIFRSLLLARGTWIQFLLMSLGLSLTAIAGWSLRLFGWGLLNFVAAIILAGALFLYFRLLGRLTWVCQEVVAEDDRRRAAESEA